MQNRAFVFELIAVLENKWQIDEINKEKLIFESHI